MTNNNSRCINCATCTAYCKNKEKSKLIKMIKDLKKENVQKVIFNCLVLEELIGEVEHEVGIRIYYKK